jgi:hypothetical protein
VNWNIRTVQHLEQVFEPYRVIFKALKGEKKELPSQFSAEKRKRLRNNETSSSWGDKFFADSSFSCLGT